MYEELLEFSFYIKFLKIEGNSLIIVHTCNSDRQWLTSLSRSPTRLSESFCFLLVVSSLSAMSRRPSFLIVSELFRAWSALKDDFYNIY